jgi:hypothetical protein
MLDLLIRAAARAASGTPPDGHDDIDKGLPNPRGESLSELSIIFVALSGLFVILRFLTRIMQHQLGWDDALIGASLVITAGMAATYNGGQSLQSCRFANSKG